MSPAWLLWFALSDPVFAATWEVCEGCAIDSIGEAISLAAPGDLLRVGPGTWAESLLIDKELKIEALTAEAPVLTNPPGLGLRADDAVVRVIGPIAGPAPLVLFDNLVIYGVGTRPLLVLDARLTMERVVIRSIGASVDGGGARVERGHLTAQNTSFIDNQANRYGGHIYAVAANVSLTRCRLSRGRALRGGGAIYAKTTYVYTEDTRFEENEALGDGNAGTGLGGAILASEGSVLLTTTALVDNRANTGGALTHLCAPDSISSVSQSTLTGNTAVRFGGAISASACTIDLRNNLFTHNVASEGGAVAADYTAVVNATDGAWCSNRATSKGGALFLSSLPGITAASRIVGVRMSDNTAGQGGDAVWANNATIDLVNSAVLSNGSGATSPFGAVHLTRTRATVHETLFGLNLGTALTADADAQVVASHNAWWSNHTNLGALITSSSDVHGDPAFRVWSDDGDCQNDDLRHGYYGVLRDTGRAEPPDRDGSPRDIGTYGGEMALAAMYLDGDEDGSIDFFDCAPIDPTIGTGQAEVWYDGVDQDCRGDSDFDQDGDGFDDPRTPNAPSGALLDCDDTDDTIFPGAQEIGGDGIDQDCDGADAADADGDGFPAGVDCDDAEASVYPGAPERDDDGVDSNCDGLDARPVRLSPRPACDGAAPSQGLAALGLWLPWAGRRRKARK